MLRNKNKNIQLNLTSLMDIFTTILLFLILTTNIGNTNLMKTKNLELPKSRSKIYSEPSTTIILTKNELYVDSQKIFNFKNFVKLYEKLNLKKNNIKKIKLYKILTEKIDLINLLNSKKQKKQVKNLLILADKTTPFEIIRAILIIARISGFLKFDLGSNSY